MATSVPDTYTVPSGSTTVRGGNGSSGTPLAEPLFLPPWNAPFTLNVTAGVADSLLGSVDIPSTFAFAAGLTIPSGVTLTTISSTQFRVNVANTVASGSYQIAVTSTRV